MLVANAGIAHYEPIAEQSLQKIEDMTAVNWLGTVYTVKAALPMFAEALRHELAGTGVSPRAADRMLRRLRGNSAAPRRD